MAWQGRVLEDAWLSTFASPESGGELPRWVKTVITNGYYEIEEKLVNVLQKINKRPLKAKVAGSSPQAY